MSQRHARKSLEPARIQHALRCMPGRMLGGTVVCGLLLAGLPQAALAQRIGTVVPLSEPVPAMAAPAAAAAAEAKATGEIHGIVADPNGDIVPGASVTLEISREGYSDVRTQTTQASPEGAFTFTAVAGGSYRLSINAAGFKPWTALGTLAEGQSLALPEIALPLNTVATEIEVSASSHEIAAAQLSLQEKQRVLGIFPNFYASYIWDAEPLSSRQKFSLAWRFSVDPVAFGMAGVVAASEQAEDTFSGYGQGARGYGKRFGALYADGFSSTMLGQAIFPAIFHQDPRYFVKGTGSFRARAFYALATTVVCKGDNRRWQLNYSNLLGNVASASLSNLYYPASDRHGASLTLQNSMMTTALGAAGGLIQEFFLHRMTPHIPDYGAIAHQ